MDPLLQLLGLQFIDSASLGVEIEHKKLYILNFCISASKWSPVLVRQTSTRRLKFQVARITLDGSIAAASRVTISWICCTVCLVVFC